MFNFTKETIINSLEVETGVARVASEAGKLSVRRCADYLKDNLAGVVTKTVGRSGSVGSATFTFPTTPGIYRVDINLKLSDKYLSDYAQANYKFSKPLIAEFEVTSTDTVSRMVKAIELAIPENYKFLKVSVSGSSVIVTCTDPTQVITHAQLWKYTENALIPSEGEYDLHSEAVIVANETPFATGEWLMEHLRFPTYPNVRHEAQNSEEYPIKGAMYTQFSFQYRVQRQGLTGLGTVGQTLESTTTHVFYVLDSLVDNFESHLNTAFGDVVDGGSSQSIYTLTLLTNEVDNSGETRQLAANISPEPRTASNFVYSMVPVVGVTLSSSGSITVDPMVDTDTELEITVVETISGVSTTKLITVV